MSELEFCQTTLQAYEREIERLINAIDEHRKNNDAPDDNDNTLYEAIDPRCW